MAIFLRFHFPVLLLISLFISGATAAALSPPTASSNHANVTYSAVFFATTLYSLGFHELSTTAAAANFSATTPLTLFAPSDAAILACSSCSAHLLLHELSIPGVHLFNFLRTLTFGTKIETLAPNRCLIITTDFKEKVFVNGVEITRPDVYSDGALTIHGIHGNISYLSPISCHVENKTTSFSDFNSSTTSDPPPPSPTSDMHLMLKDAITRLRATGSYSIVSLALRLKSAELLHLDAVTIFAIDDSLIFQSRANGYLSNFRYHLVPNRKLTGTELSAFPSDSWLPTKDAGKRLIVTTAGGAGPITINNVEITTVDLVNNTRISIHGISTGFEDTSIPQPYDEWESRFVDPIELPNCCPSLRWKIKRANSIFFLAVLVFLAKRMSCRNRFLILMVTLALWESAHSIASELWHVCRCGYSSPN